MNVSRRLSRSHSLPTLLLGPLWLAAALRIFRLDQQSMWFDEAARLLIARLDVPAILANAGRDTLPPLYHLTLHYWGLLGSTDFWLRLPSAWASLIAVAATARLAATVFGRRSAIFAGLLMAVMPYQVFHAQQANLYSFLVLLAALQMLCFRQVLTDGRLRWWAGFVLSAVAGLYVHYFAALVTLTLHLFYVLARKHYPGRGRMLLLADAAIAAAFLPQLASFWRESAVVAGSFWLARPSALEPLVTLYLFVASYSLPPLVLPFALFVVLAFLGVGLVEWRAHLRRVPGYRIGWLFVALLTFLPIMVVWLISQAVPVYLDRVLIVVTPAFAVLLASVPALGRRRSPAPYLGLVALAVMGYALFAYYTDPAYSKPDYRRAAALVAARAAPGEAIVHTSSGSYLPFLLYGSRRDELLLAGDPAPHHPAGLHELAGGRAVTPAELATHDRLWLVVALEHSVAWQQEQVAWFDRQWERLEQHDVGGIQVIHYARVRSVAAAPGAGQPRP